MASPSLESLSPAQGKSRWAINHNLVNLTEQVFALTTGLLALIPIAISVAIVVFIVIDTVSFFQTFVAEGKEAGASIADFFRDREWTVMFEPPEGGRRSIGVTSLIVSSGLVSLISIGVAAPLGTLLSILMSEFVPKGVNYLLMPLLNLISGIPTVVLGSFAFFSFSPFLQKFLPQLQPYNILSSGIIVGLFVTPIVVGIGVNAIKSVPRSYFEAAYSLGLRKHEYILQIVLPTVTPALIAAFTLALSRSFGETMIPVLASGLTPQFTFNPLQAGQTVSSFIFQAATAAVEIDSLEFKSMFAVALVLFILTFVLNSIGNYSRRSFANQMMTMGVSKAEEVSAQTSTVVVEERVVYEQRANFAPKEGLRNLEAFVFRLLTFVSVTPIVLILLFLVITNLRKGAKYLNWKFITQFADPDPEQAGILVALVGNLWLVLIVVVILIVVGLGAAIFLEEYATITLARIFKNNKLVDWIETILEINLDNLSALPTIIYGVVGVELFVIVGKNFTGGRTVISGAITLAVLALPFIITNFRTSLRTVPPALRYAGYAVGMSKFQVILGIIIPYAFSGLSSGVFLAAAVTMGETAALGAVVGSLGVINFTPFQSEKGPFLSQFVTIPLQIYLWSTKPQTEPLSAAAIVVLLGLLLVLGMLALFTANLFQSKTYES
jgi:phosphate ABC transporter permease subunit PstA